MQLKTIILTSMILNAVSLAWADTPPGNNNAKVEADVSVNSAPSVLPAVTPASGSPDALFQGFLDYDQSLSDWKIQNSYGRDYDTPVSIKNKAFENSVRDFYYGPKSVWQPQDAEQLTTQIKAFVDYTESKMSVQRPDPAHPGAYLPNPAYTQPDIQDDHTIYTSEKINALKDNRNFDVAGFPNYTYEDSRRAIIVKNANARLFPTHDGFYRDSKLAGEGANFDYMQNSAVWAGTPVYILGYSKDQQWVFIWTRDCMGWVESERIAGVSQEFVNAWMNDVKEGLGALINSNVPIYTEQDHDHPWEQGYVGMVFPFKDCRDKLTFAVPVKGKEGMAEIHFGNLGKGDIVRLPYSPTPRHLVDLIRSQLGRIYDWGGGRPYGLSDNDFYNDASSEMENLMVPFDKKVPRHSTGQVSESEVPGRAANLTSFSQQQRIDYLQQYGHPFMTIMSTGAGTCLYLGNYVDPMNPARGKVPLSYCNAYGLPAADNTYRAVIKHSGILPILPFYQEDKNLISITNRSAFVLMNLDEAPELNKVNPN